MKKLRRLASILCIASILTGMMISTAFAADESGWVEKAPIPSERTDFSTATLGEKIYAIGGYSDGYLKSGVAYDTAADTWSPIADMLSSRKSLAAVSLNGKIYAMGGNSTDSGTLGVLSSVEIYDPVGNTWSQGKSMSYTRACFMASAVNGKIYAMGGIDRFVNANHLSSVEVYAPALDTWTEVKSMPNGCDHAVSTVVGKKIYVMGGSSLDSSPTYAYDTELNTWETKAPIPEPLNSPKAVSVGNKIYLMGGINPKGGVSGISNRIYVYDVASDTWQEAPIMMPEPCIGFGAEVVDNVIYAIGGVAVNQDNATQYNTVKTLAFDVAPKETSQKLSVIINTGETLQLSVSHDLVDNASLAWSSSNQTVATVDADGKVTAVGTGECDIWAQNADGTWKQSIPVLVLPGSADQFRLAVHLKSQQSLKLHLTDNPADTVWESVDAAVATVNATGEVTAVSQGLAILKATADGQTQQIYVRVKG